MYRHHHLRRPRRRYLYSRYSLLGCTPAPFGSGIERVSALANCSSSSSLLSEGSIRASREFHMVFFGCRTGVIFLLSPALSLLAFEGEEDNDEDEKGEDRGDFEEEACFLFRVVVTMTTSEGLLSAVNVDNDDDARSNWR